jgi:hypothetical protein
MRSGYISAYLEAFSRHSSEVIANIATRDFSIDIER